MVLFRLESNIDLNSPDVLENKKMFIKCLDEYRSTLKKNIIRDDKNINRHLERGKLLVRDRINLLLDQDTPFLELSPLAAYNQYDNQFPSAGIVTGVGIIHGQETMIVANDATVKGGTYIKETIKKHIRAQEIALENRLPCVYMVDSGGVFLPEQSKVFPDKDHFGRFFYNQARLSAKELPQIAIVMGSCTAGGAYVPAMSDEVIIVKNQGTIFIGGPPLVKAATGEVVTSEDLGGAFVHTSKSGVADHLAKNDQHALQICRNIFQNIPIRKKIKVADFEEPYYNPEELYSLAPMNLKKQLDPREIIMRIVDGSYFQEFKENYATTIVTGFAKLMGMEIGIIANNGVLFGETALKGAHFIELCCYRKIPLVFLQNITGFIVGKEYENNGIARDGAKLVHAVANANVPKFTIVFGGSFGAGNYAMAGRAFNPRFLYMWPNAKISVMGGEQAANVLIQVKEEQLLKQNKKLNDEEKEKMKLEILNKYETEGSAYFSTSRLWDDGIIDPINTRKILAMSIATSKNRKIKKPRFGVYRM